MGNVKIEAEVVLPVGCNTLQPIKLVKHSELKRWNVTSPYRSECPECRQGILMVSRDQDTFKLREHDRCLHCGQIFAYLDIEEMRKNLG